MSAELNITIPFTPELLKWQPLIASEDYDFSNDSVAIVLYTTGLYTNVEVGEILTVARELGYMTETKYRDNLGNFKAGIAMGAKHLLDMMKQGYKVGLDGKVVQFRQAVAVPHLKGEKDNKPRFVRTKSDQSVQAAIDYIFSKVKGDLVNYLTVIAINKGDVKKVAKDIKKMVDEIVKELE